MKSLRLLSIAVCRDFVGGPVQIIHGDEDIVVPIEHTHEAMKIYQNAHLDIIPGQGHTFDQTGISKATVILQKWFPTVL